jgi:hypothetical protein
MAGARAQSAATVTTPDQLLRHLFSGQITRLNGISKSLVGRADKIGRLAEESKHQTGQHPLFIGWPLLYAPALGTKTQPLLAPLFFLPIEVSTTGTDITFKPADIEDLRPNLLLQQWAQEEHHQQIALENAVDPNTDYSFAKLAWNNATLSEIQAAIGNVVGVAFKNWYEIEARTGVGIELEPSPTRDIAKIWQNSENPPKLISGAILGVAEFKGQALLADLKKLRLEAARNPENLGLLDYFIKPSQSGDEPTAKPPEQETDKLLVCDSDPSQEVVIWQARQAPLIVVQGPPGSGKSQTIVNLVADALDNGETVAVFSQKRAALEVIKKRAEKAQFGELCVLLDDPSQQRADFIKTVRDIDRDSRSVTA